MGALHIIKALNNIMKHARAQCSLIRTKSSQLEYGEREGEREIVQKEFKQIGSLDNISFCKNKTQLNDIAPKKLL